jgi:hypothetical protein
MIEIKKTVMMEGGEAIYYTLETTRFWRLRRPEWGTLSFCSAVCETLHAKNTPCCRTLAWGPQEL